MIKVALTGASGRVGGAVMGHLADLGWDVVGQARSGPEHYRSPLGKPLETAHFDLFDGETLAGFLARHRPAAILHFAGLTPHRAGTATEADHARINVDLTRLLCETAHRHGVQHVLVASTAAVYAAPTDRTPIEEHRPLRPTSPYGASKRDMERWAAAASATLNGMRITCLRYGNIAGADAWLGNVLALADPAEGKLVLDCFDAETATSDPSPLRSYIAIEEIARVNAALVEAALAGRPIPAVLNVAAPQPVTMLALLRSFEAIRGVTIPFAWRRAPESAMAALVLDTRSLQTIVSLPDYAATPDHLVTSAIGHFLD